VQANAASVVPDLSSLEDKTPAKTMAIFLDEPEYTFRWIGFLTASHVRRLILKLAAALSLGIIAVDLVLLLFRASTLVLIGQSIFLVVCSWIFVFGLFRLFVSLVMAIFEQIADATSARWFHYLRLGYWMFCEAFLALGFLGLLVCALLLPFGLVPPISTR
jgi:hypothetical protein